MIAADLPDDLEFLLTPTPAPADPMLRAKLRDTTTRALRRQRQLRRLGIAAALAACYAAGMATLWLLRPSVAQVPLPTPTTEVANQAAQPATLPIEHPPQRLELLAEQADGADSARLYVAAGRKFGREQGDWDSALRCYRNALDAAPQLADSIDPQNDDWLMTTLKRARQKEKVYASDVD